MFDIMYFFGGSYRYRQMQNSDIPSSLAEAFPHLLMGRVCLGYLGKWLRQTHTK